MDLETLWLYSLASVSIIWAIFGLRAALSVMTANIVLAGTILFLPQENIFFNILPLCYPIYWTAAFLLFSFIESLSLPSLGSVTRAVCGFIMAFALILFNSRGWIIHNICLINAVYIAPIEERPMLLKTTFADATYEQVCLDSNATLMRLAIAAGDHKEVTVLQDAFSLCGNASTTVEQIVKPVLDEAELDKLEFLMRCGLKPASLVQGGGYQGSALAYAALVAQKGEVVRKIVEHYPDEVKNLPFIAALLDDLETSNNTPMLQLFEELGISRGTISP